MRRVGGVTRVGRVPVVLAACVVVAIVVTGLNRGMLQSRTAPCPRAKPCPRCPERDDDNDNDEPVTPPPPPSKAKSKAKKSKAQKEAARVVAERDGDDSDDSGAEAGDVDPWEPNSLSELEGLYQREKRRFEAYHALSEKGVALRKKHGILKIAGFTRLWPPPVHGKGGMQYHAMHLYSRLASLGHTVRVFTTGSHERAYFFTVNARTLKVESTSSEKEAQLIVYQCPSKRNAHYSVLWYETTLAHFKKISERIGGFDVAHSESWAAVANSYQLGVPLTVTWHGSMMDWFRNEMNQIIQNYRLKGKMPSKDNASRLKSLAESIASETFALQTVPHHIVISDSARDDLMAADLIPGDRVHLVYNGVNEENFQPDKTARATFLRAHNVDEAAFVVGCGGRLTAEKGHGQLARAMDVVLTKHSDVVLVVAGSGGEGAKYEKLKAKGLRVVMAGMMSQDKLAQFYNAVDVFVDPYWQHHGLNTVMIEAALTATPLVVTDLAPSKSTVPNAAFGQRFGLGMKDDLVRALVYLKGHPEFRLRMGRNLRERALKLFTSTVMAHKYEEVLYESVHNPVVVPPVTGDVTCKDAYPAMCYRMPHKDGEQPASTDAAKQPKKKQKKEAAASVGNGGGESSDDSASGGEAEI